MKTDLHPLKTLLFWRESSDFKLKIMESLLILRGNPNLNKKVKQQSIFAKFRVDFINFLPYFMVFHQHFCHFSESRFLLTHKIFASQFSGIWWLTLLYLRKGKFQGLHESQGKAYFMAIRVLDKASNEIQSFQGPPDSFEVPLDTLPLQDKLVSYFHSIYSTLWLTLITHPGACFLNFRSSIKCRPLQLVSLLLGVKIWQFKGIKYLSSEIIKNICLEILLCTESSKLH